MVKSGWSYIRKSDGHRAGQMFILALNTGPERADAYSGLMVAAHLNKFSIRTIQNCFDRAKIDLASKPELYSDFGLILEERESYQKAIKNFKKALGLDQNFLEAHKGLMRIFTIIGEDEKASLHKRRVEELMKIKDFG